MSQGGRDSSSVDADGRLIDVELPFACVAFVLKIRVVNLTADLTASDPEDRHMVGEEYAVVQVIELRPFDLLDVAVESDGRSLASGDHSLEARGFLNALQHCFL